MRCGGKDTNEARTMDESQSDAAAYAAVRETIENLQTRNVCPVSIAAELLAGCIAVAETFDDIDIASGLNAAADIVRQRATKKAVDESRDPAITQH